MRIESERMKFMSNFLLKQKNKKRNARVINEYNVRNLK